MKEDFPGGASFMDPFLLFMLRVCHVVLSAHYCPVATYWERANLLAFLYVMFSSVFYHFPMWCPGSSVTLDCLDS